MRLIDSDTIIHYQTYDDEYEEYLEHESTVADFLDGMTDEGCPKPVDAVSLKHGRWVTDGIVMDDGELLMTRCTVCGTPYEYGYDMRYCPFCGAKMDGKDGDGNG